MSKPSATHTRKIGETRQMVARPDDDDYPSSPAAVRALLSRERMGYKVWDPFAGAGVLLAVIRDAGNDVIGTTLNDYGDQFNLGITHGQDITRTKEPPQDASMIVSNPAYGMVKANDAAIINRILDFGMDITALLMDMSFLEAIGRYENVFASRPPARIYQFIDRVTMIPHRLWEGRDDPDFPAGGATAFGWFVWERKHTGPGSYLEWIRASDFEKFDDIEKYQVDNRVKAQARRLL